MCVTFEPTKVLLVQSQKYHIECIMTFENTYSAGVLVLSCLLVSLLIVGMLLSGNHMKVKGHIRNNLSTDVWRGVVLLALLGIASCTE